MSVCYVKVGSAGIYQSNEGGEDHPHTDHHPVLRAGCRSDLEVVVGEDLPHQILLYLRGTCTREKYPLTLPYFKGSSYKLILWNAEFLIYSTV